MLAFFIAASVLVLAGARLRYRAAQRQQSSNPPSALRRPSKPDSASSWPSLLIPLFLGTILFAVYFGGAPKQVREILGLDACRPPSPKTRSLSWKYEHRVAGLHNVSDNPFAQGLFNQGLVWKWGYLIEASVTTFEAALMADPSCRMCHWGVAYAWAPFLNVVALPDDVGYPHYSTDMNQKARKALSMAERLPARSAKETAYIEALWLRFPEVEAVERRHQEWMEFLHGAKMLSIWKDDPADLIAPSLAAEAFANCLPWDFYAPHEANRQPFSEEITWGQLIDVTFDQGDKRVFAEKTGLDLDGQVLDGISLMPETEEQKVRDHRMRPLSRVIEHILLRILELPEVPPLALHLHIHLTEASMANEPLKGLPAANRLMAVSPQWKSGHLIHMPSHIYFNVGDYRKAIDVNEMAYDVDVEADMTCMPPYVPEHNSYVLVAAASMGGVLDKAEEYGQKLRDFPSKIQFKSYMSGGYDYTTLLCVWGQFGQWDKILKEPPPSVGARGSGSSQGFVFSTAIYHFSRYMALLQTPTTSRKLLQDAAAERGAFFAAAGQINKVPDTIPGQTIGIYSAAYSEKIENAVQYVKAADALSQGDTDIALKAMEGLVEFVDDLGYMEPPWVQQSPRQCLGYVLFKGKKFKQAEEVYNVDLGKHPRNPWSLLGLAQVYEEMGREEDSKRMRLRYQKSGAGALTSSCPMLQLD